MDTFGVSGVVAPSAEYTGYHLFTHKPIDYGAFGSSIDSAHLFLQTEICENQTLVTCVVSEAARGRILRSIC